MSNKLNASVSDVISVKSDFQADINDPNSIYSATCFVYVKYKYSLTLKSETSICVNTPAPIKAVLKIITDPNDPNSGIPAAGKTINFKILSFASFSSLLSSSGTTDSNGECIVKIIMSRCVQSSVEGTFKNDPDDPNTIRSSCNAPCVGWKDTFYSYASSWPESHGDIINNWIEHYWSEAPNVPISELAGESHLSGGGLLLYGKPCTVNQNGTVNWDGSTAHALRQLQLRTFTIKFKINNGSEELHPINYLGINEWRGGVGMGPNSGYVYHLIKFTNNNKIRFANGNGDPNDTGYENDKWYYVEIDYAIKYENDGSTWGHTYNELTYRVFDDELQKFIINNYKMTRGVDPSWEVDYTGVVNPNYLVLESAGGSVWFDDVEIKPYIY